MQFLYTSEQASDAIIELDSDGSDSADDRILQRALALSKETAAKEASARAENPTFEEQNIL